ncbi:MAG: ATP-grasp domain-containing protein [Lachnospiraceae bacterium]|nr:ATP-grasp domain-containing protein [Lachnospiraceae bacterium]
MGMNAAVIGAGSESIFAIRKAQALGLKVIALDGDPNAAGLKYADVSFVVDIRDNDKTAEILDKYRPDIILPVPIGRYLITAGAMNDRYGLKGVSYNSADLCTDKYSFHECMAAASLRNASVYLLEKGETVIRKENISFPLVAKPRFGSGSRGVEIFDDMDHLSSGFIGNAPFDEDYILESCIAGKEYGVDGLCINGVFHLILLREKSITPPPYRQCIAYYSVDISDPFRKKTEEYMQAAAEAAGLKDCVMHADIIRKENDDPFVIEMSPRPSGHNLHNLFTTMASGVDEVEVFVRYVLGMDHSFEPTVDQPLMIGYFDMEGKVISVPEEKYIKNKYPLSDYKCYIGTGDILGSVKDGHSLMGRGYYILKADNRKKLREYSEALKSEFEVEK